MPSKKINKKVAKKTAKKAVEYGINFTEKERDEIYNLAKKSARLRKGEKFGMLCSFVVLDEDLDPTDAAQMMHSITPDACIRLVIATIENIAIATGKSQEEVFARVVKGVVSSF